MLSQQELLTNAETQKHIDTVRKYMRMFAVELLKRGENHDATKLGDEERPTFAEYTSKLKGMTYGSEEYQKCIEAMAPALSHHYAKNRHHPEHFANGIDGMTLLDLIEMFCDWFASSERHADGNILKSIDHNQSRFNMTPQLAEIMKNTAEHFDLSFRRRMEDGDVE
jgi:hypothetical protein